MKRYENLSVYSKFFDEQKLNLCTNGVWLRELISRLTWRLLFLGGSPKSVKMRKNRSCPRANYP